MLSVLVIVLLSTVTENLDAISFLVYCNKEWKPEWGGETVFMNGDRITDTVIPKPGRVVVFPGLVPHGGKAPTKHCPVAARYSAVFQFCPGQEDVVEAHAAVQEKTGDHSRMSQNDIYLGNPNLKRANVAQNFTSEQVEEFVKCSNDPVYFIKNYIQIISLDRGLIPFELYDFQSDMVNKFHANRFNIAKLPRQSGKSTVVTAYLLWYCLFNDNVNIAILANKAATAREMLQRLQLSYENLPNWASKESSTGPRQFGIGEWKQNHGCFYFGFAVGVCLLISYSWMNLHSSQRILLTSF